jgi:hypothetical protein
MPAIVHFAPSLTAGGLLISKSQVNTQITGLVEVSVDYLCRSSDLPTVIAKFFLDAPPPIFPSRVISQASLAQGKLFMVNYGVTDQYGVATINARYAGVTSKQIKPFATFEYSSFGVAVSVYANTAGNFGSQSYLAPLESSNEFQFPPGIMTVGMRGRAESVKYTFATLDAESGIPTALPPPPNNESAFAKLELIPGAISSTDVNGRFGDVLTDPSPFQVFDPINNPPAPPETVNSNDVINYVAQVNNFPTGTDFRNLTIDQWRARGVVPSVFWETERRVEAVTPSVYVREIIYRPSIVGL